MVFFIYSVTKINHYHTQFCNPQSFYNFFVVIVFVSMVFDHKPSLLYYTKYVIHIIVTFKDSSDRIPSFYTKTFTASQILPP